MLHQKVYSDAIQTFGVDHQMTMLVEECSEVIKAVTKLQRAKVSGLTNNQLILDLLEEMTDVEIVIQQFRLLFDPNTEKTFEFREFKLQRLRQIIVEKNSAK